MAVKFSLLPADHLSESSRTAVWIVLVTVSSVLFSLGFACATPFAALAAIAGSRMSRSSALLLVAATWLANQAVGYLVLDYPRTVDSFGWGFAIGAAALLATLAVHELGRFGLRPIVQFAAAFAVAFAVDQAALFSATAVLPSNGGFSMAVILYVAKINALGFAALFALYQLSVAAGLLTTPARRAAA